jgi:hypothetical protein
MTVSEGAVPALGYARQWMLICMRCGRYTYRTMEDLLFHTRAGWPDCCGDTMDLVTKSDRPIKQTS